MFNDIAWTKKGNPEICAKGVAAYGAQFKPGHWFFVDLESEKTWWNGNPNNFENKKILIKTILAGNLLCIYSCICQWYDTDHLALTPRRSEEEEQVDLDPEQLTHIMQNSGACHELEATRR